ncbi:MAG: CoA pyrophosphatase [Halobacteriaceae archaeon]
METHLDISVLGDYTSNSISDAEKTAAVLVPIIDRDDQHYLLFTKRADHLGEHPGQISFPGGGYESGDTSLSETALREAREEINLLPEDVTLYGEIDDIRTVSGYSVTPFVGTISDREYSPNDYEVAEIIILPLRELTNIDNYRYETRDHSHYGQSIVHFFNVHDRTVWGATARILVQLLELTTSWEAPVDFDTKNR